MDIKKHKSDFAFPSTTVYLKMSRIKVKLKNLLITIEIKSYGLTKS